MHPEFHLGTTVDGVVQDESNRIRDHVPGEEENHGVL